MARRTKEELEEMQRIVQTYLLVNGNNPHKAFDALVKEHLLGAKKIPDYIKGMSDFVKESEKIKETGFQNLTDEHKNQLDIIKV